MTVEANLVSVIIPCYNQAHYLREAIESLAAQSYEHFEIIVIDDGSTDNTREVAERYEGVKCISQSNRGLAAARNAGLKASRGEYLLFLDADDRLLSDALDIHVKALASHPDCAFVYGHVKLIAADGSPLASPLQVRVDREHYFELLRRNYIWTPGAVLYRRTALATVSGFNTNVSASADFDLNLRLARMFPIHCHDRAVLEYRRHNSNMSGDPKVMLASSIKVLRWQRKFTKGNRQYETALESGIKTTQLGYGEKLVKAVANQLRDHKFKQALPGIVALLKFYPRGFAKHVVRKVLAPLRSRNHSDSPVQIRDL